MTRQEAESRLFQWFGINRFYDEQWEAIEKLLRGERILMIQRTGFGKSLVYQFAGMALPGTTVIFSPLIALMRDQVNKLEAKGIPAAFINSSLTAEEKQATIEKARKGQYKLLYIAPERQEDEQWNQLAQQLQLGMIVVDEAHCISVWGHDFRPSYRRIVNLVKQLPREFPVLACTATATERVEQDIEKEFDNSRLTVIRGSLSRPNFNLHVIRSESQEAKMLGVLQEVKNAEGTGIIYCGTQVESEMYAKWLEFNDINANYYNASLDNETRKEIEQALMDNTYKCIVSTNALGMGMDKPDVRFIIHTQVPVSPLHYYQEIGRAGRDGLPTKITLFYHEEDDQLPMAFINGGRPSVDKYHKVIYVLQKQSLGLYGIIKAVNAKQTTVNVILADLMDQGIIIKNSNKQYEYKYGAPILDASTFEGLRVSKLHDFQMMKDYVNTSECRMSFLRKYLGDTIDGPCLQCDVDLSNSTTANSNEEGLAKIEQFRETYFPELEVESSTGILVNGTAASYYGVSNVGSTISRCKYQGDGDFPDYLLRLTLKAFRKKFGSEHFDLILYVPPTESGDLVKNFSEKIAKTLQIPLSHNLTKLRGTEPQKIFESSISKKDNLNGAFTIREDVRGKKILLIDDIFDSGTTIKEIGALLKRGGAQCVAPLTIAKTVGGR